MAAALVSQRIRRVQYREIDYPTGEPGYICNNFDRLDYGIELFLASGCIASVIWSERVLSSLEFIEDTLDEELKGQVAVWDVSTSSRWRGLLGVPIREALVYWGVGETADHTIEVPALYGLGIGFENGARVHLALGECYDDRPEVRGGEDLTVFFGDAVLRRYGIDPDRPTTYEPRPKTAQKDLGKMPGKPSYRLSAVRNVNNDKSD